MSERAHDIDFDGLMRILTVTGFVALTTWVAASAVGVISGYVAVSPPATLRFLLAVLILVFSRRTYWELREQAAARRALRLREPAVGAGPRLRRRAGRWVDRRRSRDGDGHGLATPSGVT
jgi:hypothetical protein